MTTQTHFPGSAGIPRGLIPLLSGNVLFGGGLFFHAFLYNFYLGALGHAEGVMGFAAASLTTGGLTILLPAGKIVDRWGGKMALVMSAMLGGIGLASGAIVTTPFLLYGSAFVAGAGTGLWRVAVAPMLMQLATGEARTRAFSWNVALLVASGAVWIAVAGGVPQFLERAWSWSEIGALRAALLAGAVGTALSIVFFWRVAGAAHSRAERVSRSDSLTWTRPAALSTRETLGRVGLVALVALWMVGPALVTPFFNVFFQRTYDFAIERIGVIFAVAHAVTAVGVFVGGEIAARVGARRMLAVWVLLFPPVMWVLSLGLTVYGAVIVYVVQGFVSPATNALIDELLLERVPTSQHGWIASWRNAATEGSGAVGAGLGGRVLEASSFARLFVVAGLAAVIAGPALLAGFTRARVNPVTQTTPMTEE